MRPSLAAGLALLLAATWGGRAEAALCGTILNPVTVSATAIDFGAYSPSAPVPTVANGTVSIRCQTLGLDIAPSFTVALSAGNAASFSPRALQNGAHTLRYNIYTTGAFTTVWGDGTGGTLMQTYSQTLLVGDIALTAFGRIDAGQFVPAGVYGDTVTVTVTY